MNTEKFVGDANKRAQQGAEGALQVGAVLQSRYKITGVLGVGGMGSVYQARDMHFPDVTRYVAVKEMLNLTSDPSLRQMTLRNFEREANILAALSHPAIPKIFDYFSNKDRAYLVMEYINGKDLEAIVNSMPNFLPMDMVRKWAVQTMDVLDYLHTHKPDPIIFRDVKPSNIMIDQHGNVRLIDFGIAKTFEINSSKKGTMIGTEGYSPPEQYRGEASPVADLYALGATLHHILTRRDPRLEPPFTFLERPIREINPSVPADFEKIVMRALNFEPGQRYNSAKAMKDALEATMQPTVAPMVTPAPTPVAPSASTPRATPVQTTPSNAPIDATSNNTRVIEELPVDGTAAFVEAGRIKPRWQFKCEDEIRSTPVLYKGIVYVGAYDNNLYAINAADGAFKWKYAADGGIPGTPGIDPDNNFVVFGSEDNLLHAVDIRTGKLAWTYKTAGPIRGSVNVALGHAFFGSDDGTLYAVRLNTGRMVWKLSGDDPIRSKPAVTSDRVVVGNEGGDVIGLDLAGAVKWRFKAKRAVTSSPFIHENIAYFGSLDSQFYAVDVTNGWTTWRVRLGRPVLSSPLVVGKQLFVGAADGFMYCLDVNANGKEMWKFETKGQIVSSPVYADGAIYFGSADKSVYSIDTKKGKLRWSFETGGPVASSGALTDGMLYIGSTDQILYALTL